MPIPDAKLPDTIATPEGDNEYPPDAPLNPAIEADPEIPNGNAPTPYDADKDPKPGHKPEDHKPEGIEKFIDEVVRGEYM